MDSSPSAPRGRSLGWSRNLIIVTGVLLFHALVLWALHTGLLRRAVEILVPVQLLAEFIEPPRPVIVPPPTPVPPAPVPKKVAVRETKPTPLPPPEIQPVANPDPAPNAPTAVATPPAPFPPITAPQAVVAAPVVAPAAPPAPPRVELPSSDAEYLQNPKPQYPALSKRLAEQGTVQIRVLIGVDGLAHKGQIERSSGFDRLDQSALATVLKWRYVPGKRAGVPEAMWFMVPIEFVLR